MDHQQDQLIWMLTDIEFPSVDEGSKFGSSRRKSDELAERVLVSLDPVVLSGKIVQFVQQINVAFGQLPEESDGKYHLNEIEMSVKITAEGQVVLLGSGGKVGGEGSITFRLTRK